jgi:hypothetical protein
LPLVILFALAFGPLLAVARDHILGFISLDDALIAYLDITHASQGVHLLLAPSTSPFPDKQPALRCRLQLNLGS